MNLLSPPWWVWPLLLFALPMAISLLYNRFYRHRSGISQHVVLGLFIVVSWLTAMILILQRLQ